MQEIKDKADDLDRFMNLIKEKIKVSRNQREKIQLLTRVPISWSRKRIQEEFEVTDYAVR